MPCVRIDLRLINFCQISVFIDGISGKLYWKGNTGLYFIAMILLWISVVFAFGLDWFTFRALFVSTNGSPTAELAVLDEPDPVWWFIPGFMYTSISDAILVRTYCLSIAYLLKFCRYGDAMLCGRTNIFWLLLACYIVQIWVHLLCLIMISMI